MDHNAILRGECEFPAIGSSSADIEELFRLYGLMCGGVLEVISQNPDPDDYEQEIARQEAISGLIPGMQVLTTILLTQDVKVVMPLFVQYFLNDPDCLYFLEIMKANNPDMSTIQDRLSSAWGL